ncbi:MAG: histidinol dehydrogenase, partial [Alphaproteobacteria bacterium]|nr:histidinol dehydrogenase [Alphaproteobacteria bacterium]
QVKHAGAIFLGKNSCGAMSDYSAGPSHVLPTNHSARFASALSTQNFLKRTSILECSEEALIHLSENTATLAEMEGLDAHKKSMEIRLETLGS